MTDSLEAVGARSQPNVFEYGDYRRFLADCYAFEKAARYGFSVRVFARRARIRSSNYLRLVIDGKRNLSRPMAERFAQGCGLQGQELDFFCELVEYGQAKSSAERNRSYERLARFRQFRSVRQLDGAQAEYHSTWYLPAIRELCRRSDFVEDPRWIARQLLPRISATQAKRALATLLRLSLLERDDSGRLRQAAPLVTTGTGPLGHHVFNFHHMMLERAGHALDHVAHDEREVSCITVCVSDAQLAELKQRLRAFRRELLQQAELGNTPERVVQVNFQLFPMSVAVDAPPITTPAAVPATASGAKVARARAKRRRV
jgi:uncharacterized protein (TIGR02147 family)